MTELTQEQWDAFMDRMIDQMVPLFMADLPRIQKQLQKEAGEGFDYGDRDGAGGG